MLIVKNSNTDPYFNLALEEYLFKVFKEDCFMLWCNENAVVVGKHQNTLAEVNMSHVNEKQVKVVRRLSGGGTVFHDLGNINFTFISTGKSTQVVDFKKYMTPILEVLLDLGLDAAFSERNDLLVEGKKVSGNAEHAVKNRILHHGTLLFNSKLSDLGNVLKVKEGKYTDKAVKSVRSQVTNISSHLKDPLTQYDFVRLVNEHVENKHDNCVPYELTDEDIAQVEQLAREKFSTWEWNFGYSPKYIMDNTISIDNNDLNIRLDVQKGVIKALNLRGDDWEVTDLRKIEQKLTGSLHKAEDLNSLLEGLQLSESFHINSDELVKGMF